VDWRVFTPVLNKAIPRATREKGGRPPFNNLFMFKVLIIKRLYHLSYDQTECQINDRLSFMKFLKPELQDHVPDSKTIWLYDDMLSKSETGIFELFFQVLSDKGYYIRAGSIVDASVIEIPRSAILKAQVGG